MSSWLKCCNCGHVEGEDQFVHEDLPDELTCPNCGGHEAAKYPLEGGNKDGG